MQFNLHDLQQQEREPLRIRIPFLREQIGLGDVISNATSAVGVQPCGGCQERQQQLNQRIVFNPWAT
jgi:hypothetical protein